MQSANKSFNSVVRENQELRNFMGNIEVKYQQYQQQQQKQFLGREREYFREKQPKRHEKVVYEEETDSEPEANENKYLSEEIEEDTEKQTPEKKNPQQQKRKNNIFEYINDDAKRNKQ